MNKEIRNLLIESIDLKVIDFNIQSYPKSDFYIYLEGAKTIHKHLIVKYSNTTPVGFLAEIKREFHEINGKDAKFDSGYIPVQVL